ncbi:Fungal lipase-type domain-containing protein [Caenorhabditis elegans]|uniref:Fungal lipase-type domain-containing protein n=1 Tax=Caenorhabditis elegans TaxID=6239 RepID=O16189_CAEEL|nr:Fungal lipase-like domain-containing protein [Caenorhabditis elegans]CCD69965.1 Fungal lipase-like domain-containing protein [Caenorhabditis elegans]|eukprot:NP_503390.2 Uncharacterized protein CELE_F25A2.1 [Caenorhabditis elegans]
MLFIFSVLICKSFSHSSIPYSDQLSRNKLIYAAISAYASPPQSCMSLAFQNFQVKPQITVACDTLDDTCSGFTGVDHESQAILVAFRGTNRNAQLLVEAVETVFANNKSWVSGGHVSEYFSDAFFKIWTSGMKDDVISLMSRYPSYQVWVTGHSLGGALASLAATYLRYTSLVSADQLLLVTFGQPRTGNMDFATSVDNLVPNAYRVTHSHDPVPHLPGQGHHGYFHHKSEVYYNKNMGGWEICEKDESEKCSNGNLVDLDFEDHFHYFNLDILKLGFSNCLNTTPSGIQ